VVPVASYESSSGAFDSVELAASNYSGSECDVLSTPTAQTSSSTLAVAVDVSRDTSQPGCEVSEGGLSTGAIIGIAVGGTVLFVVLLVILIVYCRKRELARTNARFLANTYEKDRSSVALDKRNSEAGNNGDGDALKV
jgi:hypothetical protein